MQADLRRCAKALARRAGVLLASYEHANYLAPHLSKLLDALAVDVVVDVGANRGQFGRLLRDEVGYCGPILSFEPVAASFRALLHEVNADALWSAHQLGLGSVARTAEIHLYGHSSLNSLLPPSAYGADRFSGLRSTAKTEVIQIDRLDALLDDLLDDLLDERPQRIFLKSDTQGHDLAVLEGAAGVVDRVVGFAIEAPLKEIYAGMTTMEQALRVADDLGFEMTGFFPITRDEKHLSIIEADLVFRRAE